MPGKKKPRDRRAETEQYVAFLEKRLASKNYRANVSDEEFAETKAKLDKARLVLRMLAPTNNKKK